MFLCQLPTLQVLMINTKNVKYLKFTLQNYIIEQNKFYKLVKGEMKKRLSE